MESLFLALVPLFFLILLIAGVAMFVDVAFFDGRRFASSPAHLARLWEPPYAKGRQLLAWARERGVAMAETLLAGDADGRTRRDVVKNMHTGAMTAMLPRVPPGDARRVVPCPVGGQGTVGVTTPEVIELVARIRSHSSRQEQREILERARAFAADPDGSSGNAPPGCALQGEGCICMVYADRPLRCRPLHSDFIRPRALGRPSGEDAADRARARVVAEGVEDGWVRTLTAAGRDGQVYELNSALTVGLETPDLSERWRRGEAVLSTCAPAPRPTMWL